MVTSKEYIGANTDAVVYNCIRFYLWNNQTFEETIAKTMKRVQEYCYCNSVEYKKAIVERMETMSTKEGFEKTFKKNRWKYISPFYKTVKEFIVGEFEEEITVDNIVKIISMELKSIH